MAFLDRPYGRPYEPSANPASKKSKWGQPEDVIGTVVGRIKWDQYNWSERYMCRFAGFLASRNGHPLSNNPHGVAFPMYQDWRTGWLAHNSGTSLKDIL